MARRRSQTLEPPREERERQVSDLAARGKSRERELQELLRKLAPSMLPRKVDETLATGTIASAIEEVRLPPAKELDTFLRKVAQDGWKAGLLEAGRSAERLRLPGLEAMVKRVVDRDPDLLTEQFGESTGDALRDELRRLRRREVQRRRRDRLGTLPPVEGPSRVITPRILRAERKRMQTSLRRTLMDAIQGQSREDSVTARIDDPQRVANVMDILREGGPGSLKILEREQLGQRAAMGSVAEVDWQSFQTAHIERTRQEPAVATFQWVAARDEFVTCICQVFDSQVIMKDDPEMLFFAPRLHYNCRCAFFPRTITDRALITWDQVQTFVVGEPRAGATKRTLRMAPRHAQIPQSKPNQPPPKRCSDWVDRGRQTPLTVKQSVDTSTGKFRKRTQDELEKSYVLGLARKKDRQVRTILGSLSTP